MNKPIVLVIGTRAEAIKLIPVYLALKEGGFNPILCATFQHFELLEQACNVFDVVPDYNLGIMRQNQDLFHIMGCVLERIRPIFDALQPYLVMVHGDTTTTLAAALAAFYLHIPIAHVEAGLRTGNMQWPFPEEMNRKVVGQIASYHFTPTPFATANVLAEGVSRDRIFYTGNTVVDALFLIKKKIAAGEVLIDEKVHARVAAATKSKRKKVLLTAHRRESFDGGLTCIFRAMKDFAQQHDDVIIFFPVHPNPHVYAAVEASGIAATPTVELMKPLAYKDLVYLLSVVDWVVTDSGGIQEEAVSLGKHVLCLRDVTERAEGVWEDYVSLVGTDYDRILKEMEEAYCANKSTKKISFVYGDGQACKRIVTILRNQEINELGNRDGKVRTTRLRHKIKSSRMLMS